VRHRSVVRLALAGFVAAAIGCSPSVDLAKTLTVTDVFSGWYDFGVTDGLNKLVPSITFSLRNQGTEAISQVQLLVGFWQDGADGDWESKEITGVGSSSLQPGASTDPILVRSNVGYTLEQPRAELFSHRSFKDVTAKVFAKRDGRIVPLGEFKMERRIIPHLAQTAGRP
jgi:hypothetical protein